VGRAGRIPRRPARPHHPGGGVPRKAGPARRRHAMKKTAAERLDELAAMDREIWAQGIVFAGLDEAGRGPLAGPVVAGCAVMPCEPLLCGVDDSKKLSAKRREALYERILETAVFAGTGVASVEEIDRLNILEATRLAMERAAGGAP